MARMPFRWKRSQKVLQAGSQAGARTRSWRSANFGQNIKAEAALDRTGTGVQAMLRYMLDIRQTAASRGSDQQGDELARELLFINGTFA